jgi:hypothetical protein
VAGSLKQLYNKDRATIVELLWQYNIEQEFDLHLWVCPRRFGKTFSTCIFLAAFAPLLHNDPINFIAQQMSNAQLAVVTFRTHLETLYRVRGYDFVILREDAEKGFAFLNFDGVAKYGNKLTEKQRKALITQDPNSCCVINIMTTTTTVSCFFLFFNSASLLFFIFFLFYFFCPHGDGRHLHAVSPALCCCFFDNNIPSLQVNKK